MSTAAGVVSLLVFEAADCLMAVPASEIAGTEKAAREGFSASAFSVDLDEYFARPPCDGPWLRWRRGTRTAWLRVRRVIDVMPIALSALTPMPALLETQQRARAFLAAGIRGDDVFLLLDPGRLTR